MPKVIFHYADRQLKLNDKRKIKSFILRIFKEEKTALTRLDYIFCSDEYLADINRRFLQHDFYTDIITFDLSEEGGGITGEVYISVDRVKDNAVPLSLPFKEEALRVIFHGALHLCGYMDKKDKDVIIMRERENHYLQGFER